MTLSQRLRTCAKHTGLDAVIELLQEAADEIDALQARAQVQGEPVTVAVDHFDNGPFEAYTNRIYPSVEIGTKLYTTPQPAQATQAEVTDGIRPEDFTVDVVVKPMGGFAPVNTQGVRVTHKPTGISVTCDAARSQHTNRHQAFETLRTILAQRPERVPMTERELELIDGMIAVQLDHAQRCDAISNRAMAEKQKGWDMERVELLRRIRSFGITAHAKKETP